MHAQHFFQLEKRHERGKACNDQDTFNFLILAPKFVYVSQW
jgi:hypothetical protein